MGDGNVQRVIEPDERTSEIMEEISTVDLPSTEVSSSLPPCSMGTEYPPESQEDKGQFLVRFDMESTDDYPSWGQGMDVDRQISAERLAQQAAGSSGTPYDMKSRSGTSSHETEQSFIDVFGRLSLQCTCSPTQECSGHSKDSGYSGVGNQDNECSPELVQQDHESLLCDVCVFKRRIIERDELEHALYIIPKDKFHEVFPSIKKNEALVYHGTEFPVVEEHQTTNFTSLHQTFLVIDNISVGFEVLHGQKFTVVTPSSATIATLSEIRSKSEERIACGFSVKVLTRCNGDKDDLYQDIIKVKLQSEDRRLHLLFPIAHYEASVSPGLYDSVSRTPTCMPEEDRQALRSCHVALLDNIGDVISLCEHLYQHKIFDVDDLDYVSSIPKMRERNAYVLRTIQTRGNILDFVVKVMQRQRQNQGAAAILQRTRYSGADL